MAIYHSAIENIERAQVAPVSIPGLSPCVSRFISGSLMGPNPLGWLKNKKIKKTFVPSDILF